ncbi:MAG: 4Fe-4S dicluster domain-containing protein [Clostridia bacterium]|nr:4Fe-4S dicluster domain-containing protein [Clostridia bacterium]
MAENQIKDQLLLMKEDLTKAIQNPVNKRQWGMVIDLQKCTGCHSCTIACIAENVLPPGVIYRRVISQETGTYPKVKKQYVARPCMQCDKPPCVPVCPVQATKKRDDKVVDIDYTKCIGCGRCVKACPYGARSLDKGKFHTDGTPQVMAYEKRANHEYQKKWTRQGGENPPIGRARKCHFCLHRCAEGLLPSCVATCIGRATYFGDFSDPDSLVSKLLKSRKYMKLLEQKGTNPRVYYLL